MIYIVNDRLKKFCRIFVWSKFSENFNKSCTGSFDSHARRRSRLKPVIELLPSILFKTKRINSATELPASFWNRKTYYCALMKTDGRLLQRWLRRDVFSYISESMRKPFKFKQMMEKRPCYYVMKKYRIVDV